MQLVKKSLPSRLKTVATKISEHNLFLLSSSVSYYAALAIAPFLMILLGVAAFLGQDIQQQIMNQANEMSPELGKMITMVFENVKEGANFGSISGIIGTVVLFSTASLVFLQFRYAFDVIYGYWNPELSRSIWQMIKERLFSMLVVLMAGLFFIISVSLTAIVEYFWGPGTDQNTMYRTLVFFINFGIYTLMFSGIHYFAPSKKPRLKEAFKIAALTAVFFVLGNVLLASYLRGVASDNIYGAAGTLLVFLVWSYYSSFIIFLSVEVFLYLRKHGRYHVR